LNEKGEKTERKEKRRKARERNGERIKEKVGTYFVVLHPLFGKQE